MEILHQTVGKNGAQLTGYLLDQSPEYPNADVRPAVLVCPGGGYYVCSDREAEPIALAYAGAGFQAFLLRYTVGQGDCFDAALADAEAALRYLRENAEQLHIDPQRIAAVGFSAGGHLAASLGILSEEKPNALVLGYPVILKICGDSLGKNVPGLDTAVTPAVPPIFLFSTSDDRLVPIKNSLALLDAAAQNHVYFESHIYLTGSHGLSLATPEVSGGNPGLVNQAVSAWLGDSVKFLHAVLGNVPVAGANPRPALRLICENGVDAPVGRLLENPACQAVIERHLPGFTQRTEEDGMSWSITLRQRAAMEPALISKETLEALATELATCSNQRNPQ